jgi:hypothetical protein
MKSALKPKLGRRCVRWEAGKENGRMAEWLDIFYLCMLKLLERSAWAKMGRHASLRLAA